MSPEICENHQKNKIKSKPAYSHENGASKPFTHAKTHLDIQCIKGKWPLSNHLLVWGGPCYSGHALCSKTMARIKDTGQKILGSRPVSNEGCNGPDKPSPIMILTTNTLLFSVLARPFTRTDI